jgi:hypothetical protein
MERLTPEAEPSTSTQLPTSLAMKVSATLVLFMAGLLAQSVAAPVHIGPSISAIIP